MEMTFNKKILKAKELIARELQKHDRPVVAFSGGKDSAVLLDLVCSVQPDIEVLVVLSDTEFDETYEYVGLLNVNYSYIQKRIEHYHNDTDKGIEHCCTENKVQEFKRALKDYGMWLSGIRKDEGHTRTDFEEVQNDNGLIKVNPILDFTEKDIWRYIALFDLDINPVYRRGYRSLSCKRCSTPEKNEEEGERDGRWRGSKNEGGECTIHTESLRK